jgi:hypothetical protein
MGIAVLAFLVLLQAPPLHPQDVAPAHQHATKPNAPQQTTPNTAINVYQSEPLQSPATKETSKENDRYEHWGLWINFILAAATIALAIYSAIQARAARATAEAVEAQGETLKQTLSAIQRQADSMDRQEQKLAESIFAARDNAAAAKENYRTIRNLERPWLMVRMDPEDPDMTIPHVEWIKDPQRTKTLSYYIENYGRSPAWIIKHWGGVKFLPNEVGKNPWPPSYLPKEQRMDIDISEFYEPKKRRRTDNFITYAELYNLTVDRTKVLYIYGWIAYRDVWGDSYETHFSFYYHVPVAPDPNPQRFYAEPKEWNYEK